ncbi:MAG: O-antigen ligase family protein [Elusimicrobiota bacterium]
MNVKTAVFIPFISLLFYGFINVKVYFLLNSLVFIYFFIYLIKLRSGSCFYLPYGYKYLFSAVFVSLFSFALSPVKGLISMEYINFISGFIIFFIVLNIDEEIDYRYFYPFLVVMAISGAYKSFMGKEELISTLKNANTLAFVSILIIGMLAEKKKYYMAIFFAGVLISTKSIAAMLSIMVVSFYYGFKNRKNIDFKNNHIVFSAMIILFLFLLVNIDFKSVTDRISWWKACLDMFFERPIFGFGYSSFTHIISAFMDGGLKSSYAHNYFLESMAENGLIFSFLWFLFLFISVRKSQGFYKYSLMAALIHSFFDFGMDTLAGWWFFMFFLALSHKKEKLMFRLKEDYRKYRIYLISSSLILIVSWVLYSYKYYRIDKANYEILKLYLQKDFKKASDKIYEFMPLYPDNIDLTFRRIEINRSFYDMTGDERYLKETAKSLEYLLLINPYYRPAYDNLERIYEFIRDDKSLAEIRNRKKTYIK